MKEIQDDLHLEKPPFRIELFDNSNISGTDAVAACVVFEKLKPLRKSIESITYAPLWDLTITLP